MRAGELDRPARVRAAVGALTAVTRALPRLMRPVSTSIGTAEPVAPPDSVFAREVAERARDELAPVVLEHSLRCWQWASAFAVADDAPCDPELLWAATMLHDLALGDDDDPEYGCFAALGGVRATATVARHRGPDEVGIVGDAIACHFHPAVPDEPVARNLHSAVNLDVVGYRLVDVSPALVSATEAAHPRTGFRTEFTAAMRREAATRPYSSAAVMWRVGARVPMRLNPLDRRFG